MSSGTDFIAILKHDHERLGRLLRTIDSGRWWTPEKPGSLKVSALHEKAELISRTVDDIEQMVGLIGK